MRKRSVVVSLIGRPNVGKSTIFNRLLRKAFKAMTYDHPGVTRDRHYGILSLNDLGKDKPEDIIIVDTGGFYPEKIEESTRRGKKERSEPFFDIMAEQAKMAIDESDLILFVVDIREGLLPFDETIADYIRSTGKPFWVVMNKYDTDKQMGDDGAFYAIGKASDYLLVSAEHDRGLTDLREKLQEFSLSFKDENDELVLKNKGIIPNHDVVANIAIIGAPNAGKSTLLNKLIGEERALVSDIAGTTVDPIEGHIDLYFGSKVLKLKPLDSEFSKSNAKVFEEFREFEEELSKEELLVYNELPEELKHDNDDDSDDELYFDGDDDSRDYYSLEDNLKEIEEEDVSEEEPQEALDENFNPFRSIKIVDTAGIRKNKLIKDHIEAQSVYRSLKAISEADVVLFMVDATKGITHQDRRLCDIALEKGKSLIIVLNKIDLIPETVNDSKKKREWMKDLRATIPWLSFCELITISAKKGSHLKRLKDSLAHTIVLRQDKVGTGRLNKIVSTLVDRHPVVLHKATGTRFKVKYVSMIKSNPPTFLFFTNKSKGIPDNFRRYLSNGLRQEFKLINTPVHLIFRTTTDIEKRMKKISTN